LQDVPSKDIKYAESDHGHDKIEEESANPVILKFQPIHSHDLN
jgi:hypothetical protein